MTNHRAALPEIVTRDNWIAARKAMHEKETAFSRERDAIISERRDLPMVEMDEGHRFEGPHGSASLIDLFEGRRQLLIYDFWFEPGKDPCEGCSMWTRDLGDLGGDFAHLHKYDTSLAFVSRVGRRNRSRQDRPRLAGALVFAARRKLPRSHRL